MSSLQGKMSGLQGKMSSLQPKTIPVKVLWDMENLWVPANFDVKQLKSNIEKAFQKQNPQFRIFGEITAVGVRKHSQKADRTTMSLSGDYNFTYMPMKTVHCRCGTEIRRSKNPELDNPYERKTDLADARLVKALFLHAISTLPEQCNILLIIADLDFISSIVKLCVLPDATWYWEDLVWGAKPLDEKQKKLHKKWLQGKDKP